MRSREPSLHSAITARLPAACSACTCSRHRLEHVAAGLGALGREIVAGARADLDRRPAPSGAANGDSRASAACFEPLAPFGFGEIEPVRRQRLVGRAGAGLIERLLARLVIVGDLREALVRGFLGQRLEHHRACLRR